MIGIAKRVAKGMLRRIKNGANDNSPSADVMDVRKYWEVHNVTLHETFSSREASLDYLDWRNDQYPGYIDLMPLKNKDNLVVLDYGCGPGHDLVGFGEFSKPAKLYGADVSRVSLEEARNRLALHKIDAELITIDPNNARIPIPDASVDYISSSGVLHHIDKETDVIKEFHRILKPGATCRIMIYNYDSLWMHLYTAYHKRIVEGKFKGMDMRQAFARTTDGEECPIAKCYRPQEFVDICNSAGFKSKFIGAAISLNELHLAKDIPIALMQRELPTESRKFLLALRYDDRNIPHYQGHVAGIDACFELVK